MESRHVSSPQTGTRKPESSGSGIFVPDGLGHPDQKYARDTKSRKSPQRMESRH
ncbi:hypothetical protein KI387_033922, partial [Taxus chinensis]